MFKTFLTKDALDKMTRDEVYLLFQTLRINNSLKVFILIADDVRKTGPNDIVNSKKFIELLLYHAASLHEVLEVLRLDLFERYKSALTDRNLLDGLRRWEERIKAKDETTRVLLTIRNKHAFHVASDQSYVWSNITDEPATQDVIIGVGETMQGSGFFFTWDVDWLFQFLGRHVLVGNLSEEESYLHVTKIVDAANVDLYRLFQGITRALLMDRIKSIGDKEEASREYGAPSK